MSRSKFIEHISRLDASQDDALSSYLVVTDAMGKLSDFSDDHCVGVGIKGAGKSAAYRHLKLAQGAHVTLAIDPGTHELHNFTSRSSCRRYIGFIENDFVILVLQEIHSNIAAMANTLGEDLVVRIKVFFQNLGAKAKKLLGRISGGGAFGFSLNLDRDDKDERWALSAVPRDSEARMLFRDILARVKVRIIIDDPDEFLHFEGAFDKNFIAALIIASRNLRDNVGRNFKAIVLLKPNVFRSLRSVDMFANLPLDYFINLYWSNDELKEIIAKRASFCDFNVTGIVPKTDEDAIWGHIIRYLRTGPRDVLRRFEIVLKHGDDSSTGEGVWVETLERYAQTVVDQIVAAYEKEYPRIDEVSLAVSEVCKDPTEGRSLKSQLITAQASDPVLAELWRTPWVRETTDWTNFLIELGLVSIQPSKGPLLLPYQQEYFAQNRTGRIHLQALPCLLPLV